MSMRISSAPVWVPLLVLAACSGGEPAREQAARASAGAQAQQPAENDGKIACALAGSEQFTRDCAVERVEQDGKLNLVVRHPDGGFRRFEVVSDGRGVAVADGSEEAETILVGSEIEVVVGADAYRFPATRKPDTKGNAPAN